MFEHQTHTRDDQRLYRNLDEQPWTGKVVSFHSNGKREFEKLYRNGQLEGPSTWWSDQGWRRHERTYFEGKLHGSWVEWHKLGNPRQEQIYQHGVETFRRGWWPSGQRHFEAWYRDGSEMARQVWDEQGKLTHSIGTLPKTPSPPPPLPRRNAQATQPEIIAPPHPAPTPPGASTTTPPQKQVPGQKKRAPASWAQLEKRGRVYYLKGDPNPFTGTAAMVTPDGARQWLVEFQKGVLISIGEIKNPPAPSAPGQP